LHAGVMRCLALQVAAFAFRESSPGLYLLVTARHMTHEERISPPQPGLSDQPPLVVGARRPGPIAAQDAIGGQDRPPGARISADAILAHFCRALGTRRRQSLEAILCEQL
jgi:hypothetical protein